MASPEVTPLRPGYVWSVPKEMDIPPDVLRARLDFFHQACELTIFDGDAVETKVVDVMDVARALSHELMVDTGFLPPNTLWWQNTRVGPITAIYVEPRVRTLALQELDKPVKRFIVPVPPLVFLCRPGRPPWLYAVKSKPIKDDDIVYHAPLLNVFANGLSCAGSHTYPALAADIPESFFVSFFSYTGELRNRSQKFPNDVVRMWKELEGKKHYPLNDLVQLGTITDLRRMEKQV